MFFNIQTSTGRPLSSSKRLSKERDCNLVSELRSLDDALKPWTHIGCCWSANVASDKPQALAVSRLIHDVLAGVDAGVAVRDAGCNQLAADISEECANRGSAFTRPLLFARRTYWLMALYYPLARQMDAQLGAPEALHAAGEQHTKACSQDQLASLQRPSKFNLSTFAACVLSSLSTSSPETSVRSLVAFEVDEGGSSAPSGFIMLWDVSLKVPTERSVSRVKVRVIAQIPLSWAAYV